MDRPAEGGREGRREAAGSRADVCKGEEARRRRRPGQARQEEGRCGEDQMRTTITPGERLQLVGLVALAESYGAKLEDILAAGAELLGASGDELVRDRITDAMYNGQDI